jgi:hypothetical protein
MRRDASLEKALILAMSDGKQRRGKPRTRWMDKIKEATGLDMQQLAELTRDRNEWRKKVMAVTRGRIRPDGTRQQVNFFIDKIVFLSIIIVIFYFIFPFAQNLDPISGIRNPAPESGKQHPATSGIRNPANLISGTSLHIMFRRRI